MDLNPVSLIVGIAGPVIGLVIFLLGWRKLKAEARKLETEGDVNKAEEVDTFAEATRKFMETQERLQNRNRELYEQIVTLEKTKADLERDKTAAENNNQNLADRLADRDAHIKTLSEHLKTLQDQGKQSDIYTTLVSQQQSILQIAEYYQQIIQALEKTMQTREETFKDLVRRTGPLPNLPTRK